MTDVKNTWYKVFKLTKNKSLEFEVTKIGMGFSFCSHAHIHSRGFFFESNICNVIGHSFSWDWKRDHAGLNFDVTLFGVSFAVALYDVRHWDYEKDRWETYDDEE